MEWIWKLIELLNEYNKEIWKPKRMSAREVRTHYSVIISSGYGFIKWLVENGKVDLKKADNIDNWPLFDYYSDEDALIMALSINDKSLEFLISILK